MSYVFRHRGAILRECFRSRKYNSVYYIARNDSLHIVHTHEIPSLTKIPKQMFVCLLLTEYKELSACIWKGYYTVLISQQCNVMLISFM